MKILIICTGNSCRSQMAEGFLKSFDKELKVYSAGTRPEKQVNPYAIIVMKEVGVDMSLQFPKHTDSFIADAFDFVITVCDNAKESCPLFLGEVKKHLHIGFEDPADSKGTDEEKLVVYRRIRDEIKLKFNEFYLQHIKRDEK
jgi:arsenate reductase